MLKVQPGSNSRQGWCWYSKCLKVTEKSKAAKYKGLPSGGLGQRIRDVIRSRCSGWPDKPANKHPASVAARFGV